MKPNIGLHDRILRGAIGIGLLGLAYYYGSLILAAAGIFALFEAVVSWCALYHLLGKNTCPLR